MLEEAFTKRVSSFRFSSAKLLFCMSWSLCECETGLTMEPWERFRLRLFKRPSLSGERAVCSYGRTPGPLYVSEMPLEFFISVATLYYKGIGD